MIHETALLRILPGHEQAFETAVAQAARLFQRAEGALSFRLDRRLEDPMEYVLTVGWKTIEAHTEGFRTSDSFARWRELVGPHFAAPPVVHHTRHVHTGF